MADLPALFSAPMVRAILREIEQPGTGKTQTRRVLNPQPDDLLEGQIPTQLRIAVGDRLYVREAWRTESRAYDDLSPSEMGGEETVIFEADADWKLNKTVGRLRQGMHMPRWASRLTLIVTDVRVQRLQEISEADAIAEGIYEWKPRDKDGMRHFGIPERSAGFPTAVRGFRDLWDSLNAARGYGWDANPWVAAYTFRPMLGNINQVRP